MSQETSMQRGDPSDVLSRSSPAHPSGESPAADLRSGTADDAGILFRQYVRYVARIGQRILGARDDVDDVIQDVFLAVHHDLHNLRDPGSTKGWIATIAVRAARQRLAERAAQRRIREIPQFELEALGAPSASAEHTTDLSRMLQVLLALPLLDRSAWLLKNVDNQPLGRIAALSNCSESTAQRRIRAAESSMRGVAFARGFVPHRRGRDAGGLETRARAAAPSVAPALHAR
jgi:RNA polymerase sigma-70 factor (ECF subfamily)